MNIKGGEKTYHLQEMIGKGGYGCVYRCFDVADNKRYACKVVAKRNLTDKSVKNLQREVNILFKVKQHENLLGLHDLVETDYFVCIIMPHMEGGSLFKKIHAGTGFSEATARGILMQIARGIEYLHTLKICHRDLKPNNILCTAEPEHYRVVISDYGLSKPFGPNDLLETDCGTPYYEAPEIYKHEGAYSEKCDIWSFGVIAYVLFTGWFPFDCKDLKYLPNVIIPGNYNRERLSVVSPAAREFIDRLLRVNPGERPTASDLVSKDPWLNATGGEDIDLSPSAARLNGFDCCTGCSFGDDYGMYCGDDDDDDELWKCS